MASGSVGQAGENLVLFLSLVPFVMDREEVSIEEAAAQFGRSASEIKKAIELIACAGIPGESTSYLHTDLFDIDWDLLESEDVIRFQQTILIDRTPRLSTREISALIAGLQYIAAHPSYGQRDDVVALLEKLRGASAPDAGGVIVNNAGPESVKSLLAIAIVEAHQVEFDYVSRSSDSERRVVDPVALEARDGTWYLRGWCHGRRALRVFRLDRMSTVVDTGRTADTHADSDAVESWEIFTPQETDLLVTVKFPHHALPLIAEYLDRNHPPHPEGDYLLASIPFAHAASLRHFVASNAGLVEIIAPESAITLVREWATTAITHLQQ